MISRNPVKKNKTVYAVEIMELYGYRNEGFDVRNLIIAQ